MKRIVLTGLFFLFGIFIGGVAQADIIKIYKGEVLLRTDWRSTGIEVSPQAQQYPEAVKKAYEEPGEIVAVKKKYKTEMVDLFHYRQETIIEPGVVYNNALGKIYTVSEVLEKENHFTPYLIFWGISVLCALFYPYFKICKTSRLLHRLSRLSRRLSRRLSQHASLLNRLLLRLVIRRLHLSHRF